MIKTGTLRVEVGDHNLNVIHSSILDFTKQYNRLRNQLDIQKGEEKTAPKTNPQVGTVATNASHASQAQAAPTTKAAHTATNAQKMDDQMTALSKYASRIRVDDMYTGGPVGISRKGTGADRSNEKDKADRATNEQVLDPRTRIIMFKMINRGTIYEINGCISTGKEANVYHAITEPPNSEHLAIKVYKTSILVFKDRDRYVTGEFRFRHGYSKHNPRKMVKVWAEKEMRNLKRLNQAGIPSPEPLLLRLHVLVMRFLGDKNGWAYPRLKDAPLEGSEKCTPLYLQLIKNVRRMFHVCRLVHADLSEYNILYHSKVLYIIDVSQSVEHDHPHALDFLRKDLANVNDFFSRKSVHVLGIRSLFDFVTDGNYGCEEEEMDAAIERLQTQEEAIEENASKDQVDDAVFQATYIPRTLQEVAPNDIERDVNKLNDGAKAEDLVYGKITGLAGMQKGSASSDVEEATTSDDESSDADADNTDEAAESGNDDSADESNADPFVKVSRGKRNEDKEAKKERKKATKEEAREKRKTKLPKAAKKRKIKATSGKKK